MKNFALHILERLVEEYFRFFYMRTAKRVLDTPPLRRGEIPFVLLSMVQPKDIYSYLVAVKSFARQANPSRIVVVCDPKMQAEHTDIIAQHIPHVEFLSAVDYQHDDIPKGGTWERLFAISALVTESYVVQLDADTVTTGEIPEVIAAIKQGVGFVIGEVKDQKLLSMAETAANARPKLKQNSHIQTMSEAAMEQLGFPDGSKYVRGCSGFTGFPQDENMRSKLLDYSRVMTKKFKGDWSRWGTEQVTSNYLVANSNAAFVLPYPKYGTPDETVIGKTEDGLTGNDMVFFHFIGSIRFLNNRYRNMTRVAIKETLHKPRHAA